MRGLWAQVGRQPAMEAIPLVMEPESTMYSDPVVVLDYQSLYPSQIIAYNLCFCTCLGRPLHASDPSQAHQLGASSLCLPAGTLTGSLAPDKCAPAYVCLPQALPTSFLTIHASWQPACNQEELALPATSVGNLHSSLPAVPSGTHAA